MIINNIVNNLDHMNNKIGINFGAAPAYSEGNNGLLRASNVDQLIMFQNDIFPTSFTGVDVSACVSDSSYLPEGLADFGAHIDVSNLLIRQDVKKVNAIRLPQATVGQGLLILSNVDSFQQYFINSVVIKSTNFYIRYGVCNFTANQATNPLSDGNQLALSALWSFFDINTPLLF